MNLRVGHQENVSQFSGDVRRQHFSLFAQDKTEKHAWHTTLNTVTKLLERMGLRRPRDQGLVRVYNG